MGQTQYVYAGSSWAMTSFPMNNHATNLAKQWAVPCIDATRGATSVLDSVALVKKFKQSKPIVWVYNDPLYDLQAVTGIDHTEFLTRSDWQDIWHECNQHCLNAISGLGVPVLLIGGTSDIVNCNYTNITVGHSSWQKYLASQAGMPVNDGTVTVSLLDGTVFSVDLCWGAENLHKCMYDNPNIDPDPNLVSSIWDIFYFWQQLQAMNLFHDVHPNFQANQLFADFLLPTVEKFLKENK